MSEAEAKQMLKELMRKRKHGESAASSYAAGEPAGASAEDGAAGTKAPRRE